MRMWCGTFLTLLLVGVCANCLRAGTAHGASVQPAEVESGSLIVTAETAEVREGPAPVFQVITIVGKGEVFSKMGRTGAWYYIRINDDNFGWISGRAVGRYQAEGTPLPDVAPEEEPSSYVGPYYDYSYYAWGQPYLSWEWYFYGSESHRYRTWDRDHAYQRDRDRDRSHVEGWRADEYRTRGDGRHESNDAHRGTDSYRESNTMNRFRPPPRSFTPPIRSPFMRR